MQKLLLLILALFSTTSVWAQRSDNPFTQSNGNSCTSSVVKHHQVFSNISGVSFASTHRTLNKWYVANQYCESRSPAFAGACSVSHASPSSNGTTLVTSITCARHCSAGETESRECNITNGKGTQTRSCASPNHVNFDRAWGAWSACGAPLTCNSNYQRNSGGTACVVCPTGVTWSNTNGGTCGTTCRTGFYNNGSACVAKIGNGEVCTSNSACNSDNCRLYWNGVKHCAASGRECGRPNTDGHDTGHTFVSSTGNGLNVCTETGGYIYKLNNGQACTQDSLCYSDKCRLYTTSKYCVAASKECGKSGEGGYDIGAVIYPSNDVALECKGTDPNAKFEQINTKAAGVACTNNNQCVSGVCRLSHTDARYCVSNESKECGYSGHGGYDVGEVITTSGTGVNQVKMKCVSAERGFDPAEKIQYTCPANIKGDISAITSDDSTNIANFPTKNKFGSAVIEVPFYQVYASSTKIRCYYATSPSDSKQAAYIEALHSVLSCYPELNQSSGNVKYMYNKSVTTVACWK